MSITNKKSKIKKVSETKIEKIELQPLEAYVSDPVELIRQVFSCLKSKYIKSICPEVLAGRSIQEIQECCLDELLGISKKRLLSILNATECPSDTDSSSDNGSDRDNGKECISLEEISSDDEMNEKSTGNTDNKEISVLELLELQARARAIRSQLALEPITKIELDSEVEDESHLNPISPSKANVKPHQSKSKKDKRPINYQKIFPELDHNDENEVTSTQRLVPQPQPIRLKRNFIKRENKPSASVNEDNKFEVKSNSESSTTTGELTCKNEMLPKDHVEKVDERGSSSPDIITVVQSPETYSITDSDDEKESGKVITSPTQNPTESSQKSNEKNDEIPEEGEIVEDRDSDQKIFLTSENTKDGDPENIQPNIDVKCVTSRSGEPFKRISVKTEDIESDLTNNPTDFEANILEPNLTVDLADEELDYELKDDSEPEVDTDSDDKTEKGENATDKSDVIEIYESSEEECSQSNADNTSVQMANSTTTEVEKIGKECQSFHERWLGSKKVSKILATSRLGNRLRENIKSKKAAERAQNLDSPTSEHVIEKQPELESEPVDYDVDSVEHYKNLVSNVEKSESIEKPDETEEQNAMNTETEQNSSVVN